jgi:hypothetical protein
MICRGYAALIRGSIFFTNGVLHSMATAYNTWGTEDKQKNNYSE